MRLAHLLVPLSRPALRPLWRGLLALLVVAILWLALSPAPPKQLNLGWDKLNHLSAFGTLAGVAVLGFGRRWAAVALGLVAYGALIEVLQSFTPHRSAEWVDLLADSLGIALGLALAAALGAGRQPGDGAAHPPA